MQNVTAGGSIRVGDTSIAVNFASFSQLFEYIARLCLNELDLLASPTVFFRSRLEMLRTEPERAFGNCVAFSLLCIGLGLACASLFDLGKPGLFGIGSLLGAFLVWMFISFALHPFLRLVKGRGTLKETTYVFLFCAAALHLIWIPVFSIVGKRCSETEVIVTYPYLVSYGYGDWHDIYLDGLFSNQSYHSEKYIKEREPNKKDTALIPVSEETGYKSEAAWHKDHPGQAVFATKRVPTSELKGSSPTRTETGVVADPNIFWVVYLVLMSAYYLSHFFYLAKGLAIAHSKKVVSLFGLAVAGPIALCLSIAAIGWVVGQIAFEFLSGGH